MGSLRVDGVAAFKVAESNRASERAKVDGRSSGTGIPRRDGLRVRAIGETESVKQDMGAG